MSEDTKANILVIICFIVVGSLVYYCFQLEQHKDQLMAECMKDHKEYECYSMLRTKSTTTVIPIPIGR